MKKIPIFSIIIPLYNKETSIRKTIQSVLNQDFKDFELLVIDDGSTDDSLQKISDINDDRIHIFSKLNGGVSDARNFGIKKALSEYVFFLDADDIISTNCLSVFFRLMNFYKEESVFVSNFKVIESNKNEIIYCLGKKEYLIKKPLRALWEKEIFPRVGSMLIKKKCFQEVGCFQTQISVFEDLDLIIRLLKLYNVVYTPEVLLSYQCEYNTLSQKTIPISKEFAFYIDMDNTSLYERLLLADNIYYTYKSRIKNGDFESKKNLIRKYRKYILTFLIAIIYKKMLKLLYA